VTTSSLSRNSAIATTAEVAVQRRVRHADPDTLADLLPAPATTTCSLHRQRASPAWVINGFDNRDSPSRTGTFVVSHAGHTATTSASGTTSTSGLSAGEGPHSCHCQGIRRGAEVVRQVRARCDRWSRRGTRHRCPARASGLGPA
jgi:hypothetical protein